MKGLQVSQYSKSDAAKDTGASVKETATAHHDARDDSGARKGEDKEQLKSPPEWADKTTKSGTPLFPEKK
jgi:hypothetical protein